MLVPDADAGAEPSSALAVSAVSTGVGPEKTAEMAIRPEAVACIRLRLPVVLARLGVLGPGLVVMLADTEVGSVITAAQSGAIWGYSLLLFQALLIPILYTVQELTVRLGLYTGKGHGELIRETFGAGWAWVSVGGLAFASVGALMTEFSGIAGVGALYGVPRAVSLGLAAGLLLLVVWTGSHRRVERVALLLGAFEVAFFVVAYRARAQTDGLLAGAAYLPFDQPGYRFLLAANIGAVIMPWMVFYQQSAVVDKGLGPADHKLTRWDTAIGAVITQLVMAAVLVASAATVGRHHLQASLDTVGQISEALTPYLGLEAGRALFATGVIGAAMVGAIVVSLAAAWGLGEVSGYRRSLQDRPAQAPWFYGVYAVAVIGSAIIVGLVRNLVSLSVGVEVMNALLLPVVLGFLYALTVRALPQAVRPRSPYRQLILGVIVLISGLGVFSGISGLFS